MEALESLDDRHNNEYTFLVSLLGGLEAQGLHTSLANMMNFTQIEQDELQLLWNEKKNNPGLQKCKYRTGIFISSKSVSITIFILASCVQVAP